MTLQEKYRDYKIILASKSPRRQSLFKGMGLDFEVVVNDIEEIYPDNLSDVEIAIYLAELKASTFMLYVEGLMLNKQNIHHSTLSIQNYLVITADTIVSLDNYILNKPKDLADAARMLRMLSGKMHRVITGICLMKLENQISNTKLPDTQYAIRNTSFADITEVYFKELSDEEIKYYLDNYSPLDKAGAYGAQEWIGYVGIDRILGSYFNVVGLPTHRLYHELMSF